MAQTITENSPLSFGKIVIINNNAAHEITQQSDGGYIADPEFLFFDEPEMGNVSVTGYAPATVLNVALGVSPLRLDGSGVAGFQIDTLYTHPATIVTDSNGDARFDVGATLSSSGVGALMTNGAYEGTYTLTVSAAP